MNALEVKNLLDEHKDEILAHKTRSERLDCVISLLERTYHAVSHNDALTGSITDFVAVANCIEIQPVVNILLELKTMENEALVLSTKTGMMLRKILTIYSKLLKQ